MLAVRLQIASVQIHTFLLLVLTLQWLQKVCLEIGLIHTFVHLPVSYFILRFN